LRESEEEIGVKRDSIEVLGTMTDFLSITDFAVTPVVGKITTNKHINK